MPGALVLLVAAAAYGCRGRSPEHATAGVTLRVGVSLPLEARGGGVTGLVDSLSGDPLIAVGWNGRPEARLAESWSWDASGRTLRLKLRPGVKFHDGRPLTGALVEAFLKAQQGDHWAANVAAITSEGDTVILHLLRPDSLLLTDLNFGSVSVPGPDDLPVGTGPFRITSRGEGPAYMLEANASYYRGEPAIDRLEVRSYPTQRAAWAAMMRDEIDALHEVSREAVEFVEAESTVRTYSFLRPYYISLVFNVTHPVLRHVEVRRALSLAVDRESLIKLAMRGRGRPAEGPIWPNHWAYTAASHSYSYNPEAAKLRLEAAGYRIARTKPEGRMPSRLSFNCLLWADAPQYERIALVLQKQLYEIGVDMQIEPVTGGDLVKRLAAGNFDAFLFEQTSGRSLAWVYRFWHSPPQGNTQLLSSGYRSADAVLDRLRAAGSDEEKRSSVNDLQRVLFEDPPAVFLAWGNVSRAVRNEFVVPTEGSPDIMGSLWQWRRAPRQVAER